MTREQLLAMGISEEQVNQIMALHGQATQGLNATIQQNNTELQRLRGVETDYNTLLTQQQTQQQNNEPEPQNPELASALQRIAELESENRRAEILAYASSNGLSGDKVANILTAFGDNVESAKSAIDSISQIISDTDTSARADEKQKLLNDTPNPNGGQGGDDDKPEDVANVEGITFGGLSENAQASRDYYK